MKRHSAREQPVKGSLVWGGARRGEAGPGV